MIRRLGWYALLAGLSAVFVAPLLWMLSTSLKTNPDATKPPLSWLPDAWTLRGHRTILTTTTDTPVLRWFVNSMLAATGQALLVLVTATPAAYALARMDFAGKRVVFAAVVATLFVPSFVLLIPNYLI